MFLKNITYHNKVKLSPWRKISLASWKPTGDSACYCFEEIEVDHLLKRLQISGTDLNVFIISAVSKTIEKYPEINSTVRFGQIYRRNEISVFFHVSPQIENDDLTGLLFEQAQEKSLEELNKEYFEKLKLWKSGSNQFTESKKIIGFAPAIFTGTVLNLFSFFAYSLNFCLPIFKMPRNAFGSVMLTSVGSLGIQQALCPIAPYTRVPMVISIGKIRESVSAKDGEICIRKVITFGFTFDHRIIDGRHFSEFLDTFRNLIKNQGL